MNVNTGQNNSSGILGLNKEYYISIFQNYLSIVKSELNLPMRFCSVVCKSSQLLQMT